VSSVRQQIEEWRNEVAGETVVSASAVQDRLFDLWGEVRDTPSATLVETWLTLTIEMQNRMATRLFPSRSADAIVGFLQHVGRELGSNP